MSEKRKRQVAAAPDSASGSASAFASAEAGPSTPAKKKKELKEGEAKAPASPAKRAPQKFSREEDLIIIDHLEERKDMAQLRAKLPHRHADSVRVRTMTILARARRDAGK